jgi:hypothetical protein
MGVQKNFVVKHGIEVSDDLIYTKDQKVGINTTFPDYDLSVYGDISLDGGLYVPRENPIVAQFTGTISSSNDDEITGISNLTELAKVQAGDYVTASNNIQANTVVVSVGASSVQISPVHTLQSGSNSQAYTFTRPYTSGSDGQLLVSQGNQQSPTWKDLGDISVGIATTSINVVGGIADVISATVSGNSSSDLVTINQGGSGKALDVTGDSEFDNVTALTYFGNGVNLTGIVTQITSGIGIDLESSQANGKGTVKVSSYKPIGKTIFVSQTGSDSNTGLAENHPKRTIKAAAAIAFPGDTIKVYPGVYIEENPVYLSPRVSVEGTELRNCVVTPKYTDRDLFYVNNSCHITDLSFIGPEMTNNAAIVSFQPLAGVATDRFFDAARMIRYNLDFIAAETVGYLTSTSYRNPPFVVIDSQGNPTDPVNCQDDIKSVLKCVIHDITRGGNSKCVGAGKSYYTEAGALQHIVGVKTETIDALKYAAGIAVSCINNVSWTGNFQTKYSQVKDFGMQPDYVTGSNESINSCSNVVSAIHSCVGVVTTIIGSGLSALGPSGITTNYPGNSGIGFTTVIGITSAVYENTTGQTTIVAPNLPVKVGDIIEVRDLLFECESSGVIGTQRFPSGKYGYQFDVNKINQDGSIVINTGVSTLPHTYLSGGIVVNRAIGITTAQYNNITGITTITAPGASIRVGDFVTLHDLQFSCSSGAATTTLYPTGNLGYEFKVLSVVGSGSTFVVNVGTSTISHNYVGGGVVFPAYSPGVGPITQGPYVRNCTNFIPGSVGMRVDGFNAEPGDQDDIGVTGTMSVDSYTQYNQGGIGVSITNGAYAQLVSIFTICDDIAIFTGSGGQCDITNSNSSFGRLGLVADGVGDSSTKSIYRYSGKCYQEASAEQDRIVISEIGNLRPYDGQAMYFGELYYTLDSIQIDNGGSNYTSPPSVSIGAPTGPNGIQAEASANIENGRVVSIDIISTGSQYLEPPSITFDGGGGSGISVTPLMKPTYYTIESATLPVSGITTVVLAQNLNNTVSVGTTVYFSRLSLQIASSHSFEWVGSGNDINTAKPALGGVVNTDNEVVKLNGGEVVYTSTDQAGNFRIGDGVVINQITGTVSGRAFSQSILNTVNPLIIALGN